MALVAYYPLNGDANDYSGNENNGVLGGGTFVEGKLNQAYYSNINTDRIDVSTNNLIPVFSETFSVSFWYKMDSRDSIQKFLVSFGSSAADSLLHIVVRTTNKLAFAYYANDFETTYDVPENQWVHIVCVGNKKEMKQKVYINGEFFAERNTTTWLNPPTENLVLGNRATDFPAKGIIDEVRIYDHALSEFEIKQLALFHPSANLVAHYPLDGDLLDYSGNNNHGIATNITFGEGKIKQAGIFNNSVVSIDAPIKLPIGSEQRTITSWIKLNSTYNNAINTICTYGTSSDSKNFLFSIGADRKLALYGHSSGDTYSGLIVPLDKWVFVSVVYDGVQVWFYLDGIFSNKISKNFNTILDSKGLNIGRHSTTYPFYGKIDDLRIYNKALSESEIKSLAQAKVAHYKLEDKFEQATQNLFYNKLKPTGTTKVSRFGKLYGWELTGIANDNPREDLHISRITLEPSTFYTVSAIYYSSNGTIDDFYFSFTDSGWPEGNIYLQPFVNSQASQVNGWSIIKSLGDNWFYLTGTFQTLPTTTTISSVFWDSDTAGLNIFISNLQLEKGKIATTRVDNIREGTIVKDSTYNHNHGSVTLATSPTWSSDTAVGFGSMKFNGVDQFATVPKWKEGSDTTISLWVKTTLTSGNIIVAGSEGAVSVGFWGNRIIGVSQPIGAAPTGDTTGVLKQGQWNHIAVARDEDGGMRYFCNGVKLPLSDSEVWSWNISESGFLGRRTINGTYQPYHFKGNLTDVQIFATALSDEDIYNLYTSKSKSIKFSSNSTSKLILDKTKTGIVKSTITK